MSEDFQQAASRHLNDAQYLLNKQRWDNAVYLAGYVVECSFKVLVSVYIDATSAKKYGHDLAELQGKAMERLRFIYPALDMQLPANRTMGTVLEQNHPERRYAKSGLWSEVEAKQAVQRADEIYLEIIPKLILDGRIPIMVVSDGD
jgi:HEPN domain-containing protein